MLKTINNAVWTGASILLGTAVCAWAGTVLIKEVVDVKKVLDKNDIKIGIIKEK